jgi:hypothetical protein
MRGEFIGVWTDMWREVWSKSAKHSAAPDDLFCELFRDIEPIFSVRLDPDLELPDIVNNPQKSRIAFRAIKPKTITGELALLGFLERAHGIFVDLGDDALGNRYFNLISAFIEKYNLRYDLRRPFSLHPTLIGLFSKLVRELRQLTSQDTALAALMNDFEETIRDLKADTSSGRIRACIHRQMNLLEALAQRCPNVTAGSLGEICNQIESWPHATVREAMKKLYGFASDYPGIRHAGNPQGALREIEMRDMVGITVILSGFVPYLSTGLDASVLYQGAA